MDPLPPGVTNDTLMASLGPSNNPTMSPVPNWQDKMRELQIQNQLKLINSAKYPHRTEGLTPEEEAGGYIHDPRNTMLFRSSGEPSSKNWYGLKDFLAQAPGALMGGKAGMAPAGEIASPEMGHFFTSQVASKLPKVGNLPNIVPPDEAIYPGAVLNTVGGDNSNIPPISKIPDMLRLIKDHDPYGFARLNQSIAKNLTGETRQSYQSNMDRLMGNPVGPPASHLIGDNPGLTIAKDPNVRNIMSFPETMLKKANENLPVVSRTDKRPMTQEDWNNYKKLNPSMFPEDPPNGQ